MKIPKVTLLIVTLLNIFCAQGLFGAAAAGAGANEIQAQIVINDIQSLYLEAEVITAVQNLHDKSGNIIPAKKQLLDRLVTQLDINQIKNLLKPFKDKKVVNFDISQDILMHLLLKQAIKFENEFDEEALIDLIRFAKTLQYDRNINIQPLQYELGELKKNNIAVDGNNKEVAANLNKIRNLDQKIKQRQDLINKMNIEIIPVLENALKKKIIINTINERLTLLALEKKSQALQGSNIMVPKILDLIKIYYGDPNQEVMKAVVLPNIEKTKENCVIA